MSNTVVASWKGLVEESLVALEPGKAVLCLLEKVQQFAANSKQDVDFISTHLPIAICMFSSQLVSQGQNNKAEWLWQTVLYLSTPASVQKDCIVMLRFQYAR